MYSRRQLGFYLNSVRADGIHLFQLRFYLVGLGGACSSFLNDLRIVRSRGRIEVINRRDVSGDNRVSTVAASYLDVTTNLLGGLCVVIDVAYIRVAFRVVVKIFVDFSGDLLTTKIGGRTRT